MRSAAWPLDNAPLINRVVAGADGEAALSCREQLLVLGAGGDGGIRTLDRALQPYNGLANRRLQPLGHVSRAEKRAATYARRLPLLQAPGAEPARAGRMMFCAARVPTTAPAPKASGSSQESPPSRRGAQRPACSRPCPGCPAGGEDQPHHQS